MTRIVVWAVGTVLATVGCFAVPARAEEASELAGFDCTRTDDGKTIAADKLVAEGFQVIARSRFGNANLMMVEPKSSVRANCFARPATPK